jgi:hypothetical protein
MKHFLNKLNNLELFKSNSILRIYIITIWLRYIYYGISHKYNSYVSYNVETNNYYIRHNGRNILLRDNEYMKDIIIYLNSIDLYVKDFLIENIKKFVLNDYFELTKFDNNMCENKECSICLENMNKDNIVKCIYCKNEFHETCINELWSIRHDNCPLCRKSTHISFLMYSNIKYKFFNKLYSKYLSN